MKTEFSRKQIGPEIYFSRVTDSKFKHNRISIHMMAPLHLETVSRHAMIPLLMRKGSTKQAPDENIYEKLNHLYGARLSGGTARYNNQQRISLYISALDNAYAMEGEDLVTQSVGLLLNSFFHPDFNKDFSVERDYLMDTIRGEINDKRGYAINRGLEVMFHDEVISIPQLGTLKTAEKVTVENVTAAWKQLLETAPIEIMFTGSGSPDLAEKSFIDAFKNQVRHPKPMELLKVDEKAEKVSEEREEMPGLTQGKLFMGFRSKAFSTPKEKSAASLFSAMYGGTPFSKLFLNVREKHSLAYYCAARVDSVTGYMMVDSGIEEQYKAKAEEEILLQLGEMQQGIISLEELANTKMLLANALRQTEDTPGGIESWYLGKLLQGETTTPKEDIALLESITKEDIVRIANGITLDTIYFLTGTEEKA